MTKIAFDIDDTLIVPNVAGESAYDTPNYETIQILRWYQAQGAEIILWSGSGVDYAKTWGEKLGLAPFTVRRKEAADDVDIAYDDCDVKLAKVNIRVKRLKNGISRGTWNAGERGIGSPEPDALCHIAGCTQLRKHEGDCTLAT